MIPCEQGERRAVEQIIGWIDKGLTNKAIRREDSHDMPQGCALAKALTSDLDEDEQSGAPRWCSGLRNQLLVSAQV